MAETKRPYRYNHAYTIAFEVLSVREDHATFKEWRKGLTEWLAFMEKHPDEWEEVWGTEGPFDTYEMETKEEVASWRRNRK